MDFVVFDFENEDATFIDMDKIGDD